MSKLSQSQYELLTDEIYGTLMSIKTLDTEGNEVEMGMGELGEARDEAERIVDEWMEKAAIELED